METSNDVLWNPQAFMQLGDLVASSFLISAVVLLGTSIFILVQWRGVHSDWKLAVLISAMVPFVSSIFTFFRTHYWVTTQTNPIEFRFFDWFLTVPLMSIVFFFLLRPIGAKKRMLIGLFLSALWMLGWGYLGEALEPEKSITWGLLGTLGFAGIIGCIMAIGYPKILREGVHPDHKVGYIALSILLPLGWSVYPIGYMTVPGNMLEGVISVNTVAIMYNIATIFNKAGLALGVAYIAGQVGGYYVEQRKREDAYAPKYEEPTIPNKEQPSRSNGYSNVSDSREFDINIQKDDNPDVDLSDYSQKKFLN